MIQGRIPALAAAAALAASLSLAGAARAAGDPLPPDLAKAAAAYDEAQIKGDGAALGRLLADDYALVSGGGQVQDKTAFVSDSVAPGFHIEPYTVKNPIERVWADGAVLAGEVELKGTSDGKPFAARLRFADIWRKQGGRWRVVFTEVTPLPKAAPAP